MTFPTDLSNMYGSIQELPDQIIDAWNQVKNLNLRAIDRPITHVVVAGMGGSALGAIVIQNFLEQSLTSSFYVSRDYNLPGWVNESTLVILSSYSGTTEETLEAYNQAKSKNALMAVIASGGDLIDRAKADNIPYYQIIPTHNPCNQPRMAIGYAITGQLAMLHYFKLINIDIDISELTQALRSQAGSLETQAVAVAKAATDKMLFLISANHLKGAAHILNNQINENAKQLTLELNLPELNHHYMEALIYPAAIKSQIFCLAFNSKFYQPQIRERLHLTQDVFQKNGFEFQTIEFSAIDKLTEIFTVIQFGAYFNFHLAMIHEINPAPIPWVDYFKTELKKLRQ